MSTIEKADKIVVLEQGSIRAAGTHKELIETCELYRSLYHSQFIPRRGQAAQVA